eukprot:2499293-Pleurochrysis_carterae.AAC.1
MQLVSKRHVQGFAHFTDAEAAAVGPLLKRCQRALEKATGCACVYTAALGASFPHFHCHMAPVYHGSPGEAGLPARSVTGNPGSWDVFLQEHLLSKDPSVRVDAEANASVCKRFQEEMARGDCT